MFDVEVPVRNEGMREGKKEYVSDSLDGREEERDGERVCYSLMEAAAASDALLISFNRN